MSTTILGMRTYSSGDIPAASDCNQGLWATDRLARVVAWPRNDGVISGWQMAVGASTVSAGEGIIGACYCVTTAPQAISGLTGGSLVRCYIYARLNSGSPASGVVNFVARTTSGALANPDGITYAVRLGYVVMNGTAVSGVYTSGSASFPRDKPLYKSLNAVYWPGGVGPVYSPSAGLLRVGCSFSVGGALYAGATGSGVTANQTVVDALRWNSGTLQYRTRTFSINRGIILSVATTGAWTNVP